MSEIDLTPFCTTEEIRYYLQQPWSRGMHTWSTDGHIMVRVPRRDDVPECDLAPDAAAVFEQASFDCAFTPLPGALPPPAKSEECSACDGGGREHECDDCTHACTACDGSGDEPESGYVQLAGGKFDIRLVRKMAALPGLLLGERPEDSDPLPFKFDGGAGLVMSLRHIVAGDEIELIEADREDALAEGADS